MPSPESWGNLGTTALVAYQRWAYMDDNFPQSLINSSCFPAMLCVVLFTLGLHEIFAPSPSHAAFIPPSPLLAGRCSPLKPFLFLLFSFCSALMSSFGLVVCFGLVLISLTSLVSGQIVCQHHIRLPADEGQPAGRTKKGKTMIPRTENLPKLLRLLPKELPS